MRNIRRLMLGWLLRFADRSWPSVRIAIEDLIEEFKKYVQRPLKRLVFILAFCPVIVLGSYDSFKRNPDGSYTVGGCYDGYKRNSDGSFSVGGLYDGYKRNPDDSYSAGWKCL